VGAGIVSARLPGLGDISGNQDANAESSTSPAA